MTSLVNFFLNRSYYREAFLAITIMFTISFFTPFSTILNLFLLLWGGVLILEDFLTKRIIFKSKRCIPLIAFLAINLITLIINKDLNLFENMKIFLLTVLQFLVLFLFDSDDRRDTILNQIRRFNNIIITITFVATSISLLVYMFGISFEINGYIIGIQSGMLNGIYIGANTAGPLVAISIVSSIINYQIREARKLSKFDYINIIVQLVFLYMTNSRAALYCFIAFTIIIALFYFRGIRKKVVSVGCVGVIYLLSKIVNKLMNIVYEGIHVIFKIIKYGFKKIISYITLNGNMNDAETSFLENIVPSVSEVVEKDISMGFLNGRAQLWKCGLKIINDNLWFGVGSRNIPHVALTYESISNLPGINGGGMHNIIIQTLVSNGVLGLLTLTIFIVPIILSYCRYFMKNGINSNNSKIILLIGSLLAMLLVNNMVEANILYSATYMATVFWSYLGFGLFLIDNDSRGDIND